MDTHTSWQVYPAIDLRQGRVVRLQQGDPDRETHYADNPLAVARRWAAAGARWLHVVNLDGAFGEKREANPAALERILSTGLQVQFGGGLRTGEAIRRALNLGVSRVVLGTTAVENPALVQAALDAHGSRRIAIGIDARDGQVRTRGWQETTPVSALDLACRWATRGIEWLIFTDVARDGLGTGLNLPATVHLARASGLKVIASGGVAGLEDVRRAHVAGLSGVIVGRALYEGAVSLEAALAVAAPHPPEEMSR